MMLLGGELDQESFRSSHLGGHQRSTPSLSFGAHVIGQAAPKVVGVHPGSIQALAQRALYQVGVADREALPRHQCFFTSATLRPVAQALARNSILTAAHTAVKFDRDAGGRSWQVSFGSIPEVSMLFVRSPTHTARLPQADPNRCQVPTITNSIAVMLLCLPSL
jgi:hypothetical protein